jgi:hypothetical protein
MIGHGIMTAPGGKFNGTAYVTRTELANALAQCARVLEKGNWKPSGSAVVSSPKNAGWKKERLSRYELAALLSKTVRIVQRGLPAVQGKVYNASEGIPSRPKLPDALKTSAAYASLQYLAAGRMLWSDSPLLKPDSRPLTGAEVSNALIQMIVGLNDRYTDEPEKREEIGERPTRKNKP